MWLIFFAISVLPRLPFEGKITPELRSELNSSNTSKSVDLHYVIVHMNREYPYKTLRTKSVREKSRTFREIANQSQQPLVDYLNQYPDKAKIVGKYWVFNGFHLLATKDIVEKIALRDDVWFVSHRIVPKLPPIEKSDAIKGAKTAEWNVQKVMADACWADGYTGDGVIIGHIDTGVDTGHPALQGKWTGYWLDAVGDSPLPYDDHSHGTHTIGTILGGDGLGSFADDIGIAPDAKFVTAKAFDSTGSGTGADSCMQFMADLRDSVNIRVVSNSWGSNTTNEPHYWTILNTWLSLGMFPVFSNGNNGPNPGTAGTPGNYPLVIGVGATDSSDNIASFSSRGPAPDISPWNNPADWYRTDWNFIKPDISAPGTYIRSSLPDSHNYGVFGGTSMAAPHVCGAAAILCQKNSSLSPAMMYYIITNNVDEPSQGIPYPNNDYGWGRLNIWKALQATPTYTLPVVILYLYQFSDSAGGNNDDNFDPGETIELTATLKNIGNEAYNVSGVLKSNDNYITINSDSSFFGDMGLNVQSSNTSNPYIITAHQLTPGGHNAEFNLVVSTEGDSGNFCDTFNFELRIGTPPPPYVIYEDDFEYGSGIDSFSNYWTVTGNWDRIDTASHSASHCVYSGDKVNDSVTVTLNNPIDLSAFAAPQLGYWHKFRFDKPYFTKARIDISTNGGASWTQVWRIPYSLRDSTWTQKTHDLASVSNNVKFRFMLGSRSSQLYNDWWIDDFQIVMPADNEPPYFTNTTVWPDTEFAGPFPVQSVITDLSGVDSAYLYYRVNAGGWQSLVLVEDSNGIYNAAIPTQNLEDTIDYYLWARDKWITTANTGTAPIGAPSDCYYSFILADIGIEDKISKKISFMPVTANPTKDVINIRFAIPNDMNISLGVYDVMGRCVKTLVNGRTKGGTYEITWNRKDEQDRKIATGIYFLKFSAHQTDLPKRWQASGGQAESYQETRKLVLMK